jgi:hypothetical protein
VLDILLIIVLQVLNTMFFTISRVIPGSAQSIDRDERTTLLGRACLEVVSLNLSACMAAQLAAH